MVKKLIYLYCVTKTKPSRSSIEGVGGKIYPIYAQGIYAIVSKVSADAFNFSEDGLQKNLADMKWLEQKAWQHEKVIEGIMKDTTALPFKFGTVFQKEENVEKLLKGQSTKLKRIIADLDGKEEWGLKIYCDPKRFIKEKIAKYTQDSFERLKRTSSETKTNKILPKEVTKKIETMVLNVAFLINKKRIKEFEKVLEYLKTKYSNKGLIFDCMGPTPPYNFCWMKP